MFEKIGTNLRVKIRQNDFILSLIKSLIFKLSRNYIKQDFFKYKIGILLHTTITK